MTDIEKVEKALDLIGLEFEREEDWKGALELEVFDKNGKFMGSIPFNEDGSFDWAGGRKELSCLTVCKGLYYNISVK